MDLKSSDSQFGKCDNVIVGRVALDISLDNLFIDHLGAAKGAIQEADIT